MQDANYLNSVSINTVLKQKEETLERSHLTNRTTKPRGISPTYPVPIVTSRGMTTTQEIMSLCRPLMLYNGHFNHKEILSDKERPCLENVMFHVHASVLLQMPSWHQHVLYD